MGKDMPQEQQENDEQSNNRQLNGDTGGASDEGRGEAVKQVFQKVRPNFE